MAVCCGFLFYGQIGPKIPVKCDKRFQTAPNDVIIKCLIKGKIVFEEKFSCVRSGTGRRLSCAQMRNGMCSAASCASQKGFPHGEKNEKISVQ